MRRMLLTLLSSSSVLFACGGDAQVVVSESFGSSSRFACSSDRPSASAARMWRLTGPQYEGSLRQLLGGAAVPAGLTNPFSGSGATGGLYRTFTAEAGMPELVLSQLLSASEVAGAQIAARQRSTTACLKISAPTAACIGDAVVKLAGTAFRRPVTTEEASKLRALVTEGHAALGAEALELGVEAVLSSPHFIFRTELGEGTQDATGRTRLTPYEVASSLSFTLSDAPPDEALLTAAASGQLSSAAELRPHVLRLLGEARNQQTVLRFFQDYLRYERAAVIVKDAPEFKNHRPAELVKETQLFIQDVVGQRTHVLQNLLTSSVGYSSSLTAEVNGVSAAGLPATPQRVQYPEHQRFGILTQPAFLVSWTSGHDNMPVERGKFIREQVLCGSVVGAPPPNVPKLPDVPGQTLRERLAAHTTIPSCQGCHRLMDPLGLPLEQYDHFGRFRTEEQGRPVDTTGNILAGERSIPLSGPGELARELLGMPQVRECFVQQSFRYWMGRNETPEDGCSLVQAHEEMLRTEDDLLAVVSSVMSSDSFLYRRGP